MLPEQAPLGGRGAVDRGWFRFAGVPVVPDPQSIAAKIKVY
jgi:hypothetical protein